MVQLIGKKRKEERRRKFDPTQPCKNKNNALGHSTSHNVNKLVDWAAGKTIDNQAVCLTPKCGPRCDPDGYKLCRVACKIRIVIVNTQN